MKRIILAAMLLTGCAKTYYFGTFRDVRPRPEAIAGRPAADTVLHMIWWMKSERGHQTDTSMPVVTLRTCPPYGTRPQTELYEAQRGDSIMVAKWIPSPFVSPILSSRDGSKICGEIMTPVSELKKGPGNIAFNYGCKWLRPDTTMAGIAFLQVPLTIPIRQYRTRKNLDDSCKDLPSLDAGLVFAGGTAEAGSGSAEGGR